MVKKLFAKPSKKSTVGWVECNETQHKIMAQILCWVSLRSTQPAGWIGFFTVLAFNNQFFYSYFSLLAQRKVCKRKGAPQLVLRLPSQGRFFRRGQKLACVFVQMR
ncbi:MAG: hypothetical protein SWH68_02825 [Thermodesulfobacteriota bacterium]|nr:hypothetical protein [Thermodesulfobacteriota bacterium]